MQPFIRVHQLKQSFGTQEVLKGVSFDVGKGELMALIGGAGAGKRRQAHQRSAGKNQEANPR